MADDFKVAGHLDFGANTVIALDVSIANVPIKMGGQVVGYADIAKDGAFTATISGVKVDDHFRRMFIDGLSDHLVVKQGAVPAQPRALPIHGKDRQ